MAQHTGPWGPCKQLMSPRVDACGPSTCCLTPAALYVRVEAPAGPGVAAVVAAAAAAAALPLRSGPARLAWKGKSWGGSSVLMKAAWNKMGSTHFLPVHTRRHQTLYWGGSSMLADTDLDLPSSAPLSLGSSGGKRWEECRQEDEHML